MTTAEPAAAVRHATWRRRRVLVPGVLAALIGVGIGITLTWRATTAAFNSTARNQGNSLSTGMVSLADDDSSSALFTASALVPGNTASSCIVVSYTGTAAASVKLYASPGDYTGTLGSYLALTVEQGSGGSFAGGCSGFTAGSTVYSGTMAGFASAATSYASGVGSFAAASGDQRTYRFTYTVADDNAAQNLTSTIAFTWEART